MDTALPDSESRPPGPTQSQLISAGFQDLPRAARLLDVEELAPLDQQQLLDHMRGVADPDQALLLLIRLLERTTQVLSWEEPARVRLLTLLGASEALGEFLIRRPEHLDVVATPEKAAKTAPACRGLFNPDGTEHFMGDSLRTLLLQSVEADIHSAAPAAGLTGKEAKVALRQCYRRQMVAIALEDLVDEDPQGLQPVVSRRLTELTDAAMEAALAVSRAEARQRHGHITEKVELAVIAMGKTGGQELNYISDVDVIFVHGVAEDTDMDTSQVSTLANEMAAGISTVIMQPASEPGLWEVDANLRPEGQDGALSRTVDSHLEYYRRWADTWEFQALLKARPMAGCPQLGREYQHQILPLVWQASTRDGFVAQVQAMRRRVTETLASKEREREIKLGPGGLRDVEFTVQLLQLVHGRTDESVRVRGTEEAIEALREASYIGRDDGAILIDQYRFLRLLEHRIQLVHMRRTHLMPEKPEPLRVLARSVQAGQTLPLDAERLTHLWQHTRREVRALHEQIFYRPLLPRTAALTAADVRLTPEAARERLAALGYRDPAGALHHIDALTAGVSRRAAVQRQLLPVLLSWFANGPDPDGGLLGFRRLSESLGQQAWFLRMLRDSSAAGERLCQVLSSSRYIADMLEHAPDAAAWLDRDRDLYPVPLDLQVREMRIRIARYPETEDAIRQVRLIRRREILRTAIADAADLLDQEQISHALSDADQAAVMVGLEVVQREIYGSEVLPGSTTELAVVAMGRQGGREIGYGSDMDVMFVYNPAAAAQDTDSQQQATEIAKRLTSVLKMPLRPAIAVEPMLVIDADLRPEGKQGPLVRSLSSYQEYYRRWAEIWEVQALLRARPIAGSAELQEAFITWVDEVRYHTPIGTEQLREIRRMKARVEAERLPRGADPARHVKLGRGGLSDVEWLVQTLQLCHAAQHPLLRTTSTMEALEALVNIGLLPAEEAEALHDAWLLASKIRAASMIWSARASDVLPTNRDDLDGVARWCGYDPGQASELEEDYLRTTRLARAVFEKRFYDV